MQSWRRKRQFTCLVIETDDCVVASCVLNLAAPDAVSTCLPLSLGCLQSASQHDTPKYTSVPAFRTLLLALYASHKQKARRLLRMQYHKHAWPTLAPQAVLLG